ncbi:hypothetical protein RSOLAG22IIIB_08985 [Rhizoctonia solani]|uniref:Uncharacterized protein n=1 Tax=Rhizoctonia solani TaxID=456999 RepID=A0A0K6FWE0_9AGAM|nr:hypothetical protein RSOLAG22IIIB_08985 [Rhizoctonia solani]
MARRGFALWAGTQLIAYNANRENKYQDLTPEQEARLEAGVHFIDWARSRGLSFILSRGLDGKSDARCWEHVIDSENVKKLDKKKRELCQENGMLLQDIAEFCQPYKVGDEEILVLKNKDVNIAFVFLIVEEYRAGSCAEFPNEKYDLVVVHPYPVDLTDD